MRFTTHASVAATLFLLTCSAQPVSAAMMTCDPLAACPIKPTPIKDKGIFQKLAAQLPKKMEMLKQLQQHKGMTDELKQTYGSPGAQQGAQTPTPIADAAGYKPVLPPGVDPAAAQSLTSAASAINGALWTSANSDPRTIEATNERREAMLTDTVVQAYSLAINRRQAIAEAGKNATELAQGVAKSTNLRSDLAANAQARAMVAQSADTLAELMNTFMQLEAAFAISQVPAATDTAIPLASAATGVNDGNFDAARMAALQDIAAGRLTNSVFNAITAHNARTSVMQNIETAGEIEAEILQPWEASVAAIAADDAEMIKRLSSVYSNPAEAWAKLRASVFDRIKVWKMPFGTIEQLSSQGQYEQAANAGIGAWQASYNETVKLADLAIESVNDKPETWGTLTAETKDRLSKPQLVTVQVGKTTTGNDNIGSTTQATKTVEKKATALDPETDLMPIASWINDVKEERFRQYFVTDDPTPKPIAEVRKIVAEVRADPSLRDPGRDLINQDLTVLAQNIQSAQQVVPADSKYAAQLAAAQQKYQAMLSDTQNAVFIDP